MQLTLKSKDLIEFSGLDMQIRWNRLLSMKCFKSPYVKAEDLVDNGFFYYGQGDAVECVSCGTNLGFWSEGDIPKIEHEKYAPDCPIVKGEIDITVDPEEYRQVVPKHPGLAGIQERFSTFSVWPSILGNLVFQLVEAGFYYMGSGDETQCFFCSGVLDSWQVEDDPWTKHADKFPYCQYVSIMKGIDFVVNLKFAKNHNPSDIYPTPATLPKYTKYAEVPKSLCVICKTEKRGFLFPKCGHIAVCQNCLPTNKICPICDMPYDKQIKIYFT